MVMGVLNQAFDVLVLRYGVQKRVYCNVSAGLLGESGCPGLIQDALDTVGRRDVLDPRGVRMGGQREHQTVSTQHTSFLPACPCSRCGSTSFSQHLLRSWPRDSPCSTHEQAGWQPRPRAPIPVHMAVVTLHPSLTCGGTDSSE